MCNPYRARCCTELHDGRGLGFLPAQAILLRKTRWRRAPSRATLENHPNSRCWQITHRPKKIDLLETWNSVIIYIDHTIRVNLKPSGAKGFIKLLELV